MSKPKQQAEEDFQIIINNEDYNKLQLNEKQNKKLIAQNKSLKDEIQNLNRKVKDLTRSVYVRDSFIDYVVNQCDYVFGPILNLDIISSDITQSFYQDVVSHQQNGISSIQLRDALDLYIKKNQRIFERLSELQQKFNQLNSKIKLLQQKKPIVEDHPRPSIFNADKNKNKQPSKQVSQVNNLKEQIKSLQMQRQRLAKENQKQKTRNQQLIKDNQALSKKIQVKEQKSYVIKLLIDEYYTQLQKNLKKIGGLTTDQIGTVIANEMKGVVLYINNLAKKAKA